MTFVFDRRRQLFLSPKQGSIILGIYAYIYTYVGSTTSDPMRVRIQLEEDARWFVNCVSRIFDRAVGTIPHASWQAERGHTSSRCGSPPLDAQIVSVNVDEISNLEYIEAIRRDRLLLTVLHPIEWPWTIGMTRRLKVGTCHHLALPYAACQSRMALAARRMMLRHVFSDWLKHCHGC